MKDHEIAQLVNLLRDIACTYHDHQSLRERIVQVLVPVLKEHQTKLAAAEALHDALLREVSSLVHLDPEADTPEARQLEWLSSAIEKYENVVYPIAGMEVEDRPHTDEEWAKARPAKVGAVPDECAATGRSCVYRPDGPNGELQCRYCGTAPPAMPLTVMGKQYDLPQPVWDHIIRLQMWVEELRGAPVEWGALHLMMGKRDE